MDFTIQRTEFPSAVHSAVYAKGRGVLPLSRTLESVADPALRQSCEALHGFVTEMLSDMYDHPEAYHLPVGKLEAFLAGQDIHDVKRQHQKKIKALDAQVRQAAMVYIELLCRIGSNGGLKDGEMLISQERLQYVARRVSSSISPISLEKRMAALGRIGFTMEALPSGEHRFASARYPHMFPAMCALPWDNFQMLDFRFLNGYQSTHEDYFYPLFDEQRKLAYVLHDFAMEKGMRTSLNANWGVVYQYKSKQVMVIRTGDSIRRDLSAGVVAKDKTEAYTVVEQYLGKEAPDIQEEALGRMSGCNANRCIMCSTYASGNHVTILGKPHQICGAGIIHYDWHEPTAASMDIIKRLIDLRCSIIDEAKAAKKTKK